MTCCQHVTGTDVMRSCQHVTGDTCLHWAVREGNPEIKAILLERGGEKLLSMKNQEGQTASDLVK
jgi:ankyrin repeat protein